MIATDIRLYREGLARILASEPKLTVVDTAADAAGTLRLARERAPDIALIDMVMPYSVGTVRDIMRTMPGVKIVALGVREDEHDLIACAEAGVAGYVSRDASVADLVAALERVGRGELLCSPQTAATLWRRVAALASSGSRAVVSPEGLTPREREIGALLEAGLSNKDIAVRLGIEVATVKNHVHNLLEKLHVHRRAQAVARLQGRMRRPTPVP